MRRFDKKLNLKKVNILAEQRYLQSKGIIPENVDTDNEFDIHRGGNKIHSKVKFYPNGKDFDVPTEKGGINVQQLGPHDQVTKSVSENMDDLQRGQEIVWIGAPKAISKSFTVNPGDKGEYIGRETSGEDVVEFGPLRFYAYRGNFETTSGVSSNQQMNNVSSMINHIKSNGGLQE